MRAARLQGNAAEPLPGVGPLLAASLLSLEQAQALLPSFKPWLPSGFYRELTASLRTIKGTQHALPGGWPELLLLAAAAAAATACCRLRPACHGCTSCATPSRSLQWATHSSGARGATGRRCTCASAAGAAQRATAGAGLLSMVSLRGRAQDWCLCRCCRHTLKTAPGPPLCVPHRSRECQLSDWRDGGHKEWCPALAAQRRAVG